MKHAQTVHPDMDFPESAAQQFVQSAAYDEKQHAETARR